MARRTAIMVMLAMASTWPGPVLAHTRPSRPERPADPRAAKSIGTAEALRKRGEVAFDAGKYQEALGYFNRSYLLFPDSATLLLRGSAYVKLKQCEQAIADLDAFAAETVVFGESLSLFGFYGDRAYCHMQLKNYALAAEDLEQQVRYKPDDDWAWLELGRAYGLSKQHKEAEAALKKGIALKPDDPHANYQLALHYLVTGRTREAVPYLKATLRVEPGNTDARDLLARAETELAAKPGTVAKTSPAKPRIVVKTPAETLPTSPVAATAAPRTYAPIDPRSALGRGIRLYREVELQQSLPFLEEATRLSPQDARGFAFLGAAYYRLGMQMEADAARARALALDPGILRIVN